MLDLTVDIGGLSDSLDRLSKGLEAELHVALNRTLLFMAGEAKQRAPVDTGFLRASIYPVSLTLNGHAMAITAASAQNPNAAFSLSIPVPRTKLEGFLVAGADYAKFVEFGTVRGSSFTPGYLFMTDALEKGRPILRKEALEAWRRAKRKAGFAV